MDLAGELSQGVYHFVLLTTGWVPNPEKGSDTAECAHAVNCSRLEGLPVLGL